MTGCHREQQTQHANSPGLVLDNEQICRGAYDPIHYNKQGVVKGAVVRPAHLIKGQLSVWRLGRDPMFGLDDVVDKLQEASVDTHVLRQVLAATAGEIRTIDFSNAGFAGRQVLCVLDDCAVDEKGGWHSEHATIGVADIEGVTWAIGTDPFDIVKEGLVNYLRVRSIWSEAA